MVCSCRIGALSNLMQPNVCWRCSGRREAFVLDHGWGDTEAFLVGGRREIVPGSWVRRMSQQRQRRWPEVIESISPCQLGPRGEPPSAFPTMTTWQVQAFERRGAGSQIKRLLDRNRAYYRPPVVSYS